MLRKTTDISVTTYAQQQSVERRETYALSIQQKVKIIYQQRKNYETHTFFDKCTLYAYRDNNNDYGTDIVQSM